MNVAEFLSPELWLNPTAGPLYVQLRKRLESGIESGFLAPDTLLPPEREIAALTDTSRVTVRKAIADLVEKGIVLQKKALAATSPRANPACSNRCLASPRLPKI